MYIFVKKKKTDIEKSFSCTVIIQGKLAPFHHGYCGATTGIVKTPGETVRLLWSN